MYLNELECFIACFLYQRHQPSGLLFIGESLRMKAQLDSPIFAGVCYVVMGCSAANRALS
jgi:hypothetical protein